MLSLCVILTVYSLSVGAGSLKKSCDRKCDDLYTKHYEELGCKPVYENEHDRCPKYFNCKEVLNRSSDKCYFKGTEFEIGAILEAESTSADCVIECRCSKHQGQGGKEVASFRCAEIHCPEGLNEFPLLNGCVYQYSEELCCSVNTYCSEKTPTEYTSDNTTGSIQFCSYNNQQLIQGQKVYPENSTCEECICRDENQLFCKPISCGIELHYSAQIRDGCAPIYYGNRGCCPIGWRCPSKSDLVMVAEEDSSPIELSTPKCFFGNLTLNLREKLIPEESDSCIQCSCETPPIITCVQNHDTCHKD